MAYGPLTNIAVGVGVNLLSKFIFGGGTKTLPTQEGPRLRDLAVMKSSYGENIPRVWGRMRVGGLVIWPSSGVVKETKKVETVEKDGGWFSPDIKQTFITYTYSADVALALCEGPITGIGRVWANGKLIMDATSTDFDRKLAEVANAERVTVYPGSETQTRDPLIEAVEGAANTPAFRGLAYVVFKNLQLAPYDNSMPQLEFEVIVDGTTAVPSKISDFDIPNSVPITGRNTAYRLVNGAFVETYITTNSSNYEITQTTYDSAHQQFDTQFLSLSNTLGAVGETFDVSAVQNSDEFVVVSVRASWAKWVRAKTGELGFTIELPAGVNADPDNGGTYTNDFIAKTNKVYGQGYIYLAGANTETTGGDRHFDTQFIARYPVTTDPLTGDRIASGSPDKWVDLVSLNLESSDSLNAAFEHPMAVDEEGYVWVINFNRVSESPQTNHGVAKLSPDLQTVVQSWTDIPAGYQNYSEDIALFSVYNNTIMYKTSSEIRVIKMNDDGTQTILGTVTAGSGSRDSYPLEGPFGLVFDALYTMQQTVTPGTTNLSTIVGDLCEETGLEAADYDVSSLTDTVRGYARTGPMVVREAMEPLQAAFHFDGLESDYKLKFVPRGGSSVVSIPASDLAAHGEDQEEPAEVVTMVQQELELPRLFGVRYQDINANYQQGYQYVERLNTESDEEVQSELPILFTGDEARQVADVLMYDTWTQRYTHSLQLSWKYMYLDPNDVITVTDSSSREYELRITKMSTALPGLIQVEASPEDIETYVSTISGEDLSVDDTVQGPTGPTVAAIIDGAMTSDADDNVGYYFAAKGLFSSWIGSTLYESVDSGNTFTPLLSALDTATIGRTTTALGDGSTTVFDDANTVTVSVGDGTLASSTDADVLNGANRAFIGDTGRWELVGFVSVADNGGGSYTLSRLLRGVRGTDHATANHTSGDHFVLVDAAVERQLDDEADIGGTSLLKPVSLGNPLRSVDAESFTFNAEGLKPYAPAHFEAETETDGDVALSWIRRGRIAAEWNDYEDVPLGEESESYEVDVRANGSVLRTIAVTSESATYTAAQQLTDGNPYAVDFYLYQLSATVGRGYVSIIPGHATNVLGDANDPVLWLRSDAITGLSNNDPVALWEDQSGNNHHFTSSGADRPSYRTGGLNGKPFVEFFGSNIMRYAGSVVTGSTNRTVVCVLNSSVTGYNPFVSLGTSATGQAFDLTPEYSVRVEGGNRFWTTAASGSGEIFTTLLSGTDTTGLTAYVNDVLLTVSSTGTQNINTAASARVGTNVLEAAFFVGDLFEVLIYDRALDAGERNDVWTYLSAKYNIVFGSP